MKNEMSRDELLSLPVSVDLVTAGRAFGLGRTSAFELARRDEFPCQVLRAGTRFRVPRWAIFEALGLDEAEVTGGRKPARPPATAKRRRPGREAPARQGREAG